MTKTNNHIANMPVVFAITSDKLPERDSIKYWMHSTIIPMKKASKTDLRIVNFVLNMNVSIENETRCAIKSAWLNIPVMCTGINNKKRIPDMVK